MCIAGDLPRMENLARSIQGAVRGNMKLENVKAVTDKLAGYDGQIVPPKQDIKDAGPYLQAVNAMRLGIQPSGECAGRRSRRIEMASCLGEEPASWILGRVAPRVLHRVRARSCAEGASGIEIPNERVGDSAIVLREAAWVFREPTARRY
jgi:hypothetical protein